MESREDFGAVEELVQRALAMARQLRRFDLEDWPHLRNRDEFNAIYWLPARERNSLERVYLNGRDFASQLSSLLCAFADADRYPTFRSFVDAVEDYASTQPPRLQRTLAEAEAVLPGHPDEAAPLRPMLELAAAQLAMLAPLREWLEAAKQAALYGVAARRGFEPPPGRPREIPASARGASWWTGVALLAAASAAVLLALLL